MFLVLIIILLSIIQGFAVVNETAANGTTDVTEDVGTIEDVDVIDDTAVSEREITIDLEYKADSIYDVDDDGIEPIPGVVDLTVENSQFNWDVNEDNLCTRWETYSIENDESTTVCSGSMACCDFIDMDVSQLQWNTPFYSAYGAYGATSNNVIKAQVVYVDYDLSGDTPFTEIYFSDWENLTTNYFFDLMFFKNICDDSCLLEEFGEGPYTLIIELEGGAVLELYGLTYVISETVETISVSLEVSDDKGRTSGHYELYKDGSLISEEFIEIGYYDIEIIPEEDIIDSLVIYNVNITEPLTASIGVDKVGRKIDISGVDVEKRYAIYASALNFKEGLLTATATGNSLYKCKKWNYGAELCYGEWERVKNLVEGEEYELKITPDDPGFIEGYEDTTVRLALSNDIPDINIAKNGNVTIDLGEYFSNIYYGTAFTYYEQDNISILFDKSNATIVPDKDFTGKRFTFITANDSGLLAVSEMFTIDVVEEVEVVEGVKGLKQLKADKKDFKLDEDASFDFEFLTEEELVKQGKSLEKSVKEKQKKKWITADETIETFVYDSSGELVTVEAEIEELREGKFKINVPKQRAFRAGKYRLKIELIKDGVTYTEEQDFTWGVLAINTHKSIYLENELANIGIGVLDDNGHMVCDANVTLEITNPLNQKTVLSTFNGDIKISPECEFYGVTNLPDYYTDYTVSGVGTYLMNLTAETFNGIRSIADSFVVQSSVDFDVARDGATRIYPAVPYNMSFTIKVNKNYNGLINEYVPSSFGITSQEGLTVTTVGDTKILSWDVNLKKDDIINLYYEFDAPDISPEFYLLGELEIGTFSEERYWQIASDKDSFKWNNVDLSGATANVNDNFQVTYSATVVCASDCTGTLGFTWGNAIDGGCNVGEGTVPTGSCSSQPYYIVSFADDDGGTPCDWVGADYTCSGSGTAQVIITFTACTAGSYEIKSATSGPSPSVTEKCAEPITINAAADNTPPTYSNFANNDSSNTYIGGVVNWSIDLADTGGGLDYYVFAHNASGGAMGNGSLTAIGGGTPAFVDTTVSITVGQGNYVCGQYWFNDTGGNVNQTGMSCFTVQNSPPTQPQLYYPADGKNYTSIPYINYSSTDPDGDSLTYTLYINNTINVTGISVNVTQWNASDGFYNLTVTASDGSASSVNSTVRHFRLDSTEPSWFGNETNASLMKINGNATFNITVIDNGATLSYYIFSWNGTGSWDNLTNGTVSSSSQKLMINKSTSLSQGNTIGYRWYANDSAGNWNMSLLRTFTVVNTNLVFSDAINGSLNFRQWENFTANITITDADSDLSSYIFSTNNTGSWGNGTLVSISGGTYRANSTVNISKAADNYICWKYYANDTANSIQISSEYCFTIQTTPTDSCTCPGDGNDWSIINGDQCTLAATCNLGSGIFRVTDGAMRIPSGKYLRASGCHVADGESLHVEDGGGLYCEG